MINDFRGPHAFLSNFYLSQVYYCDRTWRSVEHAYQAAKVDDKTEIVNLFGQTWLDIIDEAHTPGLAKRIGARVPLRSDWGQVRISVMRDLLANKFQPGTVLAGLLNDTGDVTLVEGNHWHDNFWGVCNCDKCRDSWPSPFDPVGQNWLGKLLMERRDANRK